MRVTSSMMTNNMMLNVNRAMRNVDSAWLQFSTGRRINVPSDNPLISARAMKFRSNLVENESFQSNVDQALAWIDVTEASLDNVLRTLMLEARDTINRAHNDPMALHGRESLITYLRNINEQLNLEMNRQFAGRYIFSGLRTDQPPIFTRDQPGLRYEITQHFDLRDIEFTQSLQIFEPELINPLIPALGYHVELPVTHPIHILKLAFRGGDMSVPTIAGFTVVEVSKTDRHAYDVPPAPPQVVHFVRETGELVFNSADVTGGAGMANFPLSVTFERWNFLQGELNPAVYFDSQLLYAPDGHSLRHLIELRYGTPPAAGSPVPPAPVPPARLPATALVGTPEYEATFFNMIGQELRYEFSTHTTIPVNTLAKNVVTDKLYADLQRLIEFVENIRPSDPERLREVFSGPPFYYSGDELNKAVADHLADEMTFINMAMNDRFNNMLFLIDRHANVARQQITDIGSRGSRIELIQNRLESDEGSLYRLKANNESIDMARLATLMASAEAQYLAALRVGTSIINVTLANFLQI